jgi:hypothetical protein
MNFIVCGAFSNPKGADNYLRFSSKVDYLTREEAEKVEQEWKNARDYPFIWIEEIK